MISWYFKFIYWFISLSIVFLAPLLFKIEIGSSFKLILFFIGLILFFYSILIASIAGKTLKKYAHLENKNREFEPNKFINIGIYKFMRHPIHLALAILPLSIALMIGNISSILAAGWSIVMAFVFVIFIEEPEAIKKYGSEYLNYIKNTPFWSFKFNMKDCIKILKK